LSAFLQKADRFVSGKILNDDARQAAFEKDSPKALPWQPAAQSKSRDLRDR
jgi:hypothetical protein